MAGLVCLSGGDFVMGNDEPGLARHRVHVEPFYIGENEVTVAEYESCSSSGACDPAGTWYDAHAQCNSGIPERALHPINCVTWYMAHQYCQSLGLRLPTEEEWVYAATRGNIQAPWGSAQLSSDRVNMYGDESTGVSTPWGDDGYLYTAPVGSFPLGATPEGIHDLVGNVWEWTESRSCGFPNTDCRSCPLASECVDRCDSCPTTAFILRGLGWADRLEDTSMHHRGAGPGYGNSPATGSQAYIGFRCARSARELAE